MWVILGCLVLLILGSILKEAEAEAYRMLDEDQAELDKLNRYITYLELIDERTLDDIRRKLNGD